MDEREKRKMHPEIKAFSQKLRREATPEERRLWYEFLKQHPRETASGLTDRRETAILKWLSWQTEADQAFLEGLLNGIEDQRDPQAASVLLDAVHSRFGGQVKEKKTTRTFKL